MLNKIGLRALPCGNPLARVDILDNVCPFLTWKVLFCILTDGGVSHPMTLSISRHNFHIK